MPILYDEPEAVYHARKEVSGSMLSKMNPAKSYYAEFVADPPQVEQDSKEHLTEGRLFHALILEPQFVKDRFYMVPDAGGKAVRRGTNAWKEHEEEAGAKEMLKEADFNRIKQYSELARNTEKAQEMLSLKGFNEVTILWTDEETGIECRGRIDRLIVEQPYEAAVCFKTAANASPDKFSRAISDFNYHMKAAFYLDGLAAAGEDILKGAADWPFFWMAIEKKAPFNYGVYAADEEMIARGRQIYKRRLRQVAECTESGFWPSYTDQHENKFGLISLKPWALYDDNNTMEVVDDE